MDFNVLFKEVVNKQLICAAAFSAAPFSTC